MALANPTRGGTTMQEEDESMQKSLGVAGKKAPTEFPDTNFSIGSAWEESSHKFPSLFWTTGKVAENSKMIGVEKL